MSSLRAQEAAKQAALKVKLRYLEQKHALDAEARALAQKKEELDLRSEIAECQAREEVLQEVTVESHPGSADKFLS